MSTAVMTPTDDPDRFGVAMAYGDAVELPAHTDGGAIERGFVTVTYLSRLEAAQRTDLTKPESALDGLLSR